MKKLDELTDKERAYVDLVANNEKLSNEELYALFDNDYVDFKNDIDLRRLGTELRLERKQRKVLIDDFKLKKAVETIPLALDTLIHIMKHGKEHNQLAAAQTLVRPAVAYLEKHGINKAALETVDENGEIQRSINIVIDADDAKL